MVHYVNSLSLEVADRSNIYHASFPSETKTKDLFNYFSKFGKMRVKWINDTSAYIIFEQDPTEEPSGGPFGAVPLVVFQSITNATNEKEETPIEFTTGRKRRRFDEDEEGKLNV